MSQNRSFWVSVVGAVTGWIGGVLLLVWSSPRLLASWHGFLHSGVATRFPSPTLVPENPYFAGEPLTYYWFYQWVGSVLTRATGSDPLHVFQFMALASLALLVVAAALTGRQLYRSTAAGLMIGFLALLGMNPLGPAIAVSKVVVRDAPILQSPRPDSGTELFVSDVEADDRMASPLLGALHIGTDWQSSQDIVWFFDVSSRGPSLAFLLVLTWLFTHPGTKRWPDVLLIPTGAMTAALNPIVGLSVAGSLVAATVATRLLGWVDESWSRRAGIPRSLGFLAGVALAAPTYVHMFGFDNSMTFTFGGQMVLKTVALAMGFLVLLPLAVWGSVAGPDEGRSARATITVTGLILIGVVPFVTLYEINQHNFTNAATCLFAVPAAAWVAGSQTTPSRRRARIRAAILVLTFVPTTVGLAAAFAGRGGLPLVVEQGQLRRTPLDGPVDAFYGWVSTETPASAVLIADPTRPVKMSGNVSEIPALTGRALFVDQRTYMTELYADRQIRSELAIRATSGEALAESDYAYLRSLDRPIYVVTFAAQEEGRLASLVRQFGTPLFQREFVAAFAVDTEGR